MCTPHANMREMSKVLARPSVGSQFSRGRDVYTTTHSTGQTLIPSIEIYENVLKGYKGTVVDAPLGRERV